MMDFNLRFQRTWNRILALVKPSDQHTFLYYLRALKNDIAIMIQSMGGTTLPEAFDIAIRAENSLIQDGKIALRPPMPIFPDLHPVLEVIPPLAVIHPIPTLAAPAINAIPQVLVQSQEMKDIQKAL
jgi:hypothetical protein